MRRRAPRAVVEQVVRRLGFVISNIGVDYLVEAVLLCCEDPGALFAVTKRVYPAVAKRCGNKWKNVERDLRTAVDNFWKRGNLPFFFEMVGFEMAVRPSVGEIIGYIVGYIRYNQLLDELEEENE